MAALEVLLYKKILNNTALEKCLISEFVDIR